MSASLLRCFILVLAALAASLTAGCGKAPKLAPLPSDAIVLAFGDSLTGALDESAPRLLLLCIGGNDFLRRLGNQQAEANVRAMVRLAKARGVQVLLIGTPEPGLLVSPPDFYGRIAKEFALPYQESVIAEVLRDSSLKSDQIHPNARGYRVIAERLAADLRKSGAI